MKFVAKPNTWYDEGTEAELLADLGAHQCYDTDDGVGENGKPIMHDCRSGLFKGIKQGAEDEEVCAFCEFEIEEG